jgi:Leucine-rich repeat (LRR) protein
LSVNRIVGSLPYQLQSLGKLQTLDASENKLAGTLPRYLNALTSLRTLVLQYNKIGGSIPAEITQLQHLATLKVDKNKLVGPLPAHLDNMSSLNELYLFNNALTGTLPVTLCALPRIVTLLLNNNQLRGTIPSCLGNLSATLRDISLRYNALTGRLPASVSALTLLVDLDVSTNHLTGPIPDDIGAARSLQSLRLYGNLLSGTLPASLANLTALQQCWLYTNQLHGSFPASLAGWTQLTELIVSQNSLDGSLAHNLSQWRKMQQFEVYSNQLTGPLPTEMPWTNLSSLQFDNNFFVGSLPSVAGEWSQLAYVNGFANFLTGSFPPGVTAWAQAIIVDFHANGLQGSLPPTLLLPAVQYFDLHGNRLTGSLPTTLPAWTSLVAFDVSMNQFRGTVGDCASLVRLNSLNVSYNDLTGSLPAGLQALTALQFVDLSKNRFTGRLGSTFAALRGLRTLFVSQNRLSGPVDVVVNTTRQRQLQQLDVSENRLSGTIPEAFFLNSTLTMLSLAQNCLTGSLPASICNGSQFETLVLDNLHGACERRIFRHTHIATFFLRQRLHGSLPRCLFDGLPALQTLHLSSNGLRGPLPPLSSLSPALRDLTLSHNALSGAIPAAIQTHNWTTLDLSFNRLRGDLLDMDVPSTSLASLSLSLAVNRLSGSLPACLFRVTQPMHVLAGNLFQCAWDNAPLPSADVDAASYECGSNATNLPLLLWATLPGLLLLLWAGAALCLPPPTAHEASPVRRWQRLRRRIADSVATLRTASVTLMSHGLRDVVLATQRLHQSLAGCVVWALVVLTPVYSWLSARYGVYGDSFVWAVSLGYLSGVHCAAVLVAVLVVTAALLHVVFDHDDAVAPTAGDEAPAPPVAPGPAGKGSDHGAVPAVRWSNAAVCAVANGAVVLTANLVFVYATTQSLSSGAMLALNWLMSLFKLFWMKVALLRLAEYFLPAPAPPQSPPQTLAWRRAKTQFLTCLSVFNNIVAPAAAEAFLSPNCFYYTIVPPPLVTPSYAYTACLFRVFYDDSETIRCGAYGTVTRSPSFRPAYVYNFQCSSSLLVTFAPIFLYKFLASALLYPAWIAAVTTWQAQRQRMDQQAPLEEQQWQSPRSGPWWLLTLPRVWRPRGAAEIRRLVAAASAATEREGDDVQRQENPLWRGAAAASEDAQPVAAVAVAAPAAAAAAAGHTFVAMEYVASAVAGDLCIVVAFGVAFPLIAAAGAVAIAADTLVLQLGMARLLSLAAAEDASIPPPPARSPSRADDGRALLAPQCAAALADETRDMGRLVAQSLRLVIGVASAVWTCFVFDALGDAVGLSGAAWVWSLVGIAALLSLWPRCWRAMVSAVRALLVGGAAPPSAPPAAGDIELTAPPADP